MTTIDAAQSPVDLETVVARFGDLPTLAPVAVQVLQLSEDERAGLDDIASVISRDPGLAGQLLRVANSSMYGMGGEVTSLHRAATILGLRTVRLLSLSFSVVTRLDGDHDRELIWRRSLAGSGLARTIAAAHRPGVAEECFIAGLLANMGKVALFDEPAYGAAVAESGGWLEPSAEAELFGFSSDDATRAILDGWGLPAVLGEAVAHRGDPGSAEGVAAEIAAVLAVADAAAGLVTADDDTAPMAFDTCTRRAEALLGLDADQMESLILEAQPAMEEISQMFQVASPNAAPVTEILLKAREGLARLSLDVVAALSQEESRAQQLESENERLANVAATDPLTGLSNRRTFDEFMDTQVAARLRSGGVEGIGLLVMDLDHFKVLNDTHGHQVGDDVLREVATRLEQSTRRDELVARIGGEEFGLVMPSVSMEGVATAAERFRLAVGASPLPTRVGPLEVTMSLGGAITREFGDDTAATLFKAADDALYRAKQAGRNRFGLAPE